MLRIFWKENSVEELFNKYVINSKTKFKFFNVAGMKTIRIPLKPGGDVADTEEITKPGITWVDLNFIPLQSDPQISVTCYKNIIFVNDLRELKFG